MVLQSPRGIESGYGVNVRNAGLRHPFFSDLGNTSEIAHSLVLGGTLNQARTKGTFQTREALCQGRRHAKNWRRIDELEAENETLQDQVDSIADIIEGEDEDDEGE